MNNYNFNYILSAHDCLVLK